MTFLSLILISSPWAFVSHSFLDVQAATASIPWAAKEVPRRQVDGQATHKACSFLALGQLPQLPLTGSSISTWPLLQQIVSHFNPSSSTSPCYLRCSPTTPFLLQSHLKLPQVPKTSTHSCQWFRGSAVLLICKLYEWLWKHCVLIYTEPFTAFYN